MSGLSWTNSHTSVDITPKGISKQTGIAHLLAQFDLPVEDTVAIGDSHNDLKMLAYVGQSMCPANAAAEAQDICNIVANQPRIYGVTELLKVLHVNLSGPPKWKVPAITQ